MLALHLGCGQRVFPGWENLDINPGPGIKAQDLTQPLPYASASVDFVYSEHFIEHLDEADGLALFKEIYRTLKPGGVARLCCPDLQAYVQAYLDWANQPERNTFHSGVQYLNFAMLGESVSGIKYLNNTISRNEGHRFHYDFMDLSDKLCRCGFANVTRVPWGGSNHPPLQKLESRHCRNLIVEAIK